MLRSMLAVEGVRLGHPPNIFVRDTNVWVFSDDICVRMVATHMLLLPVEAARSNGIKRDAHENSNTLACREGAVVGIVLNGHANLPFPESEEEGER